MPLNKIQATYTRLMLKLYGKNRNQNLIKLLTQGGVLPENRSMILDMGCGSGSISRDIAAAKSNLTFVGADVRYMDECHIPYCVYEGTKLPFKDNHFDYVMLVNVLHHTKNPFESLKEASRVAGKGIIIKDHYANNIIDFLMLAFMDLVGNAINGVPQTFQYKRTRTWNDYFNKLNFDVVRKLERFPVYNKFLDMFFGRNMHFIVLLKKRAK